MLASRRFIRDHSGLPERKDDSMYRIAYKKDLNEQVTLMKVEAPLKMCIRDSTKSAHRK